MPPLCNSRGTKEEVFWESGDFGRKGAKSCKAESGRKYGVVLRASL